MGLVLMFVSVLKVKNWLVGLIDIFMGRKQ